MPIHALLFDLDNTLYPASSGITEALESRMNAYVATVSGLNSADAKRLRQHYFVTYGTTLRGLQLHHDVDVEAYLATVHHFDATDFVAPDADLIAAFTRDTRPKAIFTNSPREHAIRVLHALDLAQFAMPIIDIRAMHFVPKPNPAAYHRALDIFAVDATHTAFFEDTLHNLAPAKSLGMTTVYIAHAQHDTILPDFVDYAFPDVHTALQQLTCEA